MVCYSSPSPLLIKIDFVAFAGFNALFSSVAPVSTSKMRKILEAIKETIDQIEAEANMAEREEAKEDRLMSQRERLLNERERKENAEMRKQQQADREGTPSCSVLIVLRIYVS